MKSKKFEFTDEQISYIIENWGKESVYSMKKTFGCTWYAVARVAKANGLELPTSNEWTKEEIETLKLLANKYHYKDIAKKMGKTENAIYFKARKLKIVLIQDSKKWTFEEEQKFKDLWGNKPIELIAKELKRSIFSLRIKAVKMELGSMISNNYEIITISDISELLGVTRDRITGTWLKLGLNIRLTKLTNKKSYMTVTWDDLMQFLENNQNEWDSRNVEKNMLGQEPAWLEEKRLKDLKENPLWYRRWTEEEIIKAINMFNNGKDYNSIAFEIDRSERAIIDLLHSVGRKNKFAQFKEDNEQKYLKENHQDAICEFPFAKTTRINNIKNEELGFQKRLRKGRRMNKSEG